MSTQTDNRNPSRLEVLNQLAKQLGLPTKSVNGKTRLFVKYQGKTFEVTVEKVSS